MPSDVFKDFVFKAKTFEAKAKDLQKNKDLGPRPRNTQGQHQGHPKAASTATHYNEKYFTVQCMTNVTLVAYCSLHYVYNVSFTMTPSRLQLLASHVCQKLMFNTFSVLCPNCQ